MSETPIPSRLQGQVIAFRADASLEIGSGHVMRCLTLADALQAQGAECLFLCREQPGHLCELIEARGYPIHRLPQEERDTDTTITPGAEPELAHAHWLGASWSQDAEACLPLLAELAPAWLVVDHYALDHRWETAVLDGLAGSRPRLLVIDDLADRHHIADLLLDQNLGRQVEDYRGLVPEACQILAGPRYALLRPEFREWREASLSRRAREPRLQRLLINLGGVDKDDVTGQVLDALSGCDLPDDLQISVVMGASAPWRESVTAQAGAMPWSTEVVVNVSDMARRMAEADLAIGAAGSTSWERCCLGLPTLMVVLADNQKEVASYLDELGAAKLIGAPLDISSVLPGAMHELFHGDYVGMSKSSSQIVTGNGIFELVSAICDISTDSKLSLEV
jgi:UDP-2,4-diacetamido-2,4,6-trideoxy-beta-L-altropyranose hydrolase